MRYLCYAEENRKRLAAEEMDRIQQQYDHEQKVKIFKRIRRYKKK